MRDSIFLSSLLFATALWAQPPSQAPLVENETTDGGWPKDVETPVGTFTVYQPQIDAFDGHRTSFFAALAHTAKEEEPPVFGVAWFDAGTDVDKTERVVHFNEVAVSRVSFPSATDNESAWQQAIQNQVTDATRTIALDRFEASLEVLDADKNVRSVPLKNDPPRVVFSTKPAILAYIDGEPRYRAVEKTKLERVLNTRTLLLRESSGKHYIHVFDGWLEAGSLQQKAPWTVVARPSEDLATALEDAKVSGQVDLLLGGNPEDPDTLPKLASTVPVIVVGTSPTELIVTQGEPNYVPIPGTDLLYAENTTGHVFKLLGDQKTYVLLSGRWFRSPSTNGPVSARRSGTCTRATTLTADAAQPGTRARERRPRAVA